MLPVALAAAAAGIGCVEGPADALWLGQARAAWHLQLRRIPELTPPPLVEVILFDRRCRLSSPDALSRGTTARWSRTLHGGRVRLADGSRIPAGVTSFAGEGRKGSSFVMALPSVWTEGKVNGGLVGLPKLTTAVLLHEASHVAQTALIEKVGALVRKKGFGEDFSDDSIQQRFEKDAEFTASMKEEIRLLFAAADAPDDAVARQLAGQAVTMMKARRARWFVGQDAALATAEDLFLSMEGAGQFVGYSWLIDPAGGALSQDVAMRGFGTRARWWSQAQGLALVLAVERLRLPGWRGHLWRDPALVGYQLLDAALAR